MMRVSVTKKAAKNTVMRRVSVTREAAKNTVMRRVGVMREAAKNTGTMIECATTNSSMRSGHVCNVSDTFLLLCHVWLWCAFTTPVLL